MRDTPLSDSNVPGRLSSGGGGLSWVFRYRYPIHGFVFVAAFLLSWATSTRAGGQRIWLSVPIAFWQHSGVSLQLAILAITVVAALLAAAGAALRTWGTAYLGAGVVADERLHGDRIVTGGPFGYMRNPLYVGTVLHALALSVLLNPLAAGVLLGVVLVLQAVLIGIEERYLTAMEGEGYLAYARLVPRILPRLNPLQGSSQSKPAWGRAFANETYMWGTAVSFAVFGATYNATLVIQGIVVAFGVSIVVRGLMGRR